MEILFQLVKLKLQRIFGTSVNTFDCENALMKDTGEVEEG